MRGLFKVWSHNQGGVSTVFPNFLLVSDDAASFLDFVVGKVFVELEPLEPLHTERAQEPRIDVEEIEDDEKQQNQREIEGHEVTQQRRQELIGGLQHSTKAEWSRCDISKKL